MFGVANRAGGFVSNACQHARHQSFDGGKIHRYLGDSIVITVLVVDKIEPTKSGKNKLIISNLKKW